MSYIVGGNIQASDFNTFATLTGGVNEVYADLHSGTTTIASGADYGYGQTPALTAVSSLGNITAADWSDLFQAMKDCGTHQGTTTVPPLPVTNPVAGDTVEVFNTPSTLASIISNLRTNRLSLAGGQTSTIVGTSYSNPGSWSTSLVYTFQVDFGSWDNARYYFNSGGKISINASYSPAPTPDEVAWQTFFSTYFPINFNWQTTTPQAGNDIPFPAGFYANGSYPALTTSYQTLFEKYVGGGGGYYYTTNYCTIEGKFTNTAGTNGKIDFRISLIDGDPFPVLKPASAVTYTVNRIQSSGVIAYPGGYTYTSGGFVGV